MAVGPGFHVDAQGNLHIGSTRETFDNTTLSEAPFSVTKAGVLKATSGSFTGDISGASGTFTGNLSGSTISGGSINIGNGTFQVASNGALTATSASISGVISAGGAAADINNNSTQIDGGKIVANSVTVAEANISGQLSFGKLSISSQNIIDTIVDNAILDTIGNGQISESKLGNLSASKITSGTISAGLIDTTSLSSVFINTSANITSALTVRGATVIATGNVETGDRLQHYNQSQTYIDIGQTSLFTFRPNGVSSGLSLSATGSSFIRSHWKPNVNNTYDLGSSGLRWDDIYTNGSVNTSDITLKTDVENTTLGLNFLNTLEPIEFKWADGGVRTHLGFSAQDVKQKLIDYAGDDQNYALYTQGSYAESVDEVDEEGNLIEDLPEDFESYGLRYDELIPILVKSIQELTARIEALEA